MSADQSTVDRGMGEMAKDDRPHSTIHIPIADKSESRQGSESVLPLPMRTQEELAPIAQRVAANPDLMQKFREVIGSEDQERAGSVVDEITNFAQEVDPTVTPAEGVRITVVLMGMVGHPKDGQND